MNREYSSAANRLHSLGSKRLGRASIASISVLLILLISASCALAWPVEDLKITPESPLCTYSGNISITGKVGPGDTVTIVTTYVKELNVTDGKYEFDAGIVPIPAGTTLCSITAENVKDMTITTNLFKFIPISKTQEACNGKATLSVPAPYIPKGNYSLVIDGNAISTNAIANCNGGTDTDKDKNKTVKLTFVAKVDVKADEKGYFKQVCCTNRPAGNYTLKVGDKTTTVTLIDCGNDETTKKTDGDTTNTNVVTSTTNSNSGGAGSANVMGVNNSTVESIQNSLDDEGPEDPEDVGIVTGTSATASANTNSIMGIIQSILNWLGF